MKKILIAAGALMTVIPGIAQQTEGKVTYERTMVMQIRLNDGHMSEQLQNSLPRSRKDNFDLVFGNNQSVWRIAEKEEDDATSFGDNGGIQIRMVGGGADDVVYTNFENRTRTEQREMFDKKFIINDSIRPMKLKMTSETKTILDHPCMKATTTIIGKRSTMSMDNGNMERKEVDDTSYIVAWFATDIPVTAGPAEYQGQLPGLILELDVNNGRQVFKAINYSSKADFALIKAPTGKKHYTQEEFRKERDKMLEEMNKNGNGGGRVMRF
ncbi:MAG: GLPGLI family protein [Chitinophagaceae bacterium]|nr:GLPGLI family protein [Chitinophagaceae bacterium]